MVFPQPGHGRRIFCEPTVEGQRMAMAIHGQGRAASRVNTDADDLIGLETAHRALRARYSFLDGLLGASDVVGGMLPRQVRVAREDYTLGAMGIIPDRRRDLSPVLDVDDDCADRVGAVIETKGVSRVHRCLVESLWTNIKLQPTVDH